VEVAARGSGGSLTSGSSGEQGSPNGSRLNVVLAIVVAVALAAAVGGVVLMRHTYDNRADAVSDGGLWDRIWSVISIEREQAPESPRVGEDVGQGTVQAMDAAPEAEQVRTADQIEAATKMANAFLNLQYDKIVGNIAAVKALATGPFLRQYTRASNDLAKLTRRAQATQTGEVDWAGLVAGDDDSAIVIVATSGTVANKLTKFKPVARTYRLQLKVQHVDGQWLTSDLQYVR
jgi:hypothetical protein